MTIFLSSLVNLTELMLLDNLLEVSGLLICSDSVVGGYICLVDVAIRDWSPEKAVQSQCGPQQTGGSSI